MGCEGPEAGAAGNLLRGTRPAPPAEDRGSHGLGADPEKQIGLVSSFESGSKG